MQNSPVLSTNYFSLINEDFHLIKNFCIHSASKKIQKNQLYLSVTRLFCVTVLFSGCIQLKNSILALPQQGNLIAVIWAGAHIAIGTDLYKITKRITEYITQFIVKEVPYTFRDFMTGTIQKETTKSSEREPKKETQDKPERDLKKPKVEIPLPQPNNPIPSQISIEEAKRKSQEKSYPRPPPPIPPKQDSLNAIFTSRLSKLPSRPEPPPVSRKKIQVPAIDELKLKSSLEIAMELAQNTTLYVLWLSTQDYWAKRIINFFATIVD